MSHNCEKSFITCTSDKGLVSRIRKELLQLNNRTIAQFKIQQKYLNRHLTKEDIQMASKHMKRCSTTYVIKEMQIKMTIRCHHTPIKMAKFQKVTIPNADKDTHSLRATGTHSLLGRMQQETATLEDNLAVPQK